MIVAILSEVVVQVPSFSYLYCIHVYGECLLKPWTFIEWSNSVDVDAVDSIYKTILC
jgi:hypothetical protein